MQKLEAERHGELLEQHGNTIDATNAPQNGEAIPPNQTIISNDESIGKEFKEAIKEATNDSKAQNSWPGISLFKRAYGGDSSPETANSTDHPGREGPITRTGDKS